MTLNYEYARKSLVPMFIQSTNFLTYENIVRKMSLINKQRKEMIKEHLFSLFLRAFFYLIMSLYNKNQGSIYLFCFF
jgi:type IV secretory pathway VirB6-like protein